MRNRSLAIAVTIAVAAAWWRLGHVAAAARCSWMATYPSAIGRQTFLLATATPSGVTASVDTPYFYSLGPVPAQVMRIDDVAGSEADIVRDGLRSNGGNAVFIRYGVGPSCAPWPARDGAFDSVGVSGLYAGRPRPAERWINRQPTFDIFRAEQYPLPKRGHVMRPVHDSTPIMTSEELFAMYRALWAESVTVDDRSVEQRIRRWLEENPRAARKQPTEQVALGMLSDITNARTAANAIPFGGTFIISVVVPGVDSLLTYGHTSSRTRPWIVDITRDSVTGIPVAARPRSFAIDVQTAATLAAFVVPRGGPNNPCAPIVIIVDDLPIVPDADSTWVGQMSPSGFLECAPPGSVLFELTRPGKRSAVALGSVPVRFHRHSDGRVTFEARTIKDGKTSVLVHGERVATESRGSSRYAP